MKLGKNTRIDFNTRYRLTGKNAASLSRTESTAGDYVGKWSGETGEIVPPDSRVKRIIEAVHRRF